MAALTADRTVPNLHAIASGSGGYIIDIGVAASTTIYKGSFVEPDAGGDIIGTSTTAGTIGLALEKADNSSGADNDITCKVLVGGVIEHTIGSATRADIGKIVYASDDQTLTFVATSNSKVGVCIGMNTAAEAIVQMTTNPAAF